MLEDGKNNLQELIIEVETWKQDLHQLEDDLKELNDALLNAKVVMDAEHSTLGDLLQA